MKWRKETQAYMWAFYFSEDGKWKVYDVEEHIKNGSTKKWYNPKTRQFEKQDAIKHFWIAENLETGETFKEFKTMKSAKEFCESR